MMLPVLAFGLLAFLLSRKRAPGGGPSQDPWQSEVNRIVRETNEIIDGKRAEYTDADQAAAQATARAAAKIAQAVASSKPSTPAAPPASSSSSSDDDDDEPAPPARSSSGPSSSTPAVQAPSSSSSSSASAKPKTTDLALARSTAPKVAAHLKQKGRAGYDRKVLKLWQERAGLTGDGIYGRGTAAALKYFTAAAPAAFFAQGTASYTPPEE